GGGSHRRGRRGPPAGGLGRELCRRRLSAAQLRRRDQADPQVATERAERGELHGGDLGPEPRHGAPSGDDGERARGGREPRQRAQGAERGAALAPEQRPAWERLLAESGARGQAASGRVYVLDAGEPKALDVRLGLTDGASTELIAGELAEGTEVIIGVADAGRNAAGQPAGGGLPRFRLF